MASNRRLVTLAVCTVAGSLFVASPARADTSPPVGSWTWPVVGPVIRRFEPPATPFSAGHRGIDIGTRFGTPVRAPADGVVSFAGWVAGSLFVTIDHGDGYRSTCSWLAQVLVRKGDAIKHGDVAALSGRGHPELPEPQLHFGVRLNGGYVDPLPLLEPQSVSDVIHLAPLQGKAGSGDASPRVVPRSPVPIAAWVLVLRDRQALPSIASSPAPGWRPARGPPGRHLE